MLKDTFYTLNQLHRADDLLTAAISIDPKHPIFAGHFPGNPITPGVVLLEIIKEILLIHVGRPIRLRSIDQCKFLTILSPEKDPDLTAEIKFLPADSGIIKISCMLRTESTRFLQVQSQYQ